MQKLFEKEISEIIKLYQSGVSNGNLAKQYSVSKTTIKDLLKKQNINLRKASPKKIYDVHFFDSYDAISVYWAGMLMADGNIRKGNKVVNLTLAEIDKEHLLKLKKCTKSDAKIYEFKSVKANAIQFCGDWFPAALEKNYSIVNNKSLICSFPKQLPKTYYREFIRGIFDGDGSIYENSNHGLIAFTGTVELLTFLRDFFHDELGVVCQQTKNNQTGFHKITLNPHNNLIGNLGYGKASAIIITNWMYENSLSETRLTRKYEKFLRLFAK